MILLTNKHSNFQGHGFFKIPIEDQIFHKLKNEEEEEINQIAINILNKLKKERKN